MPRRNHPRHPARRVRTDSGEREQKPKGKRRPRRFHRGPSQDGYYLNAARRLEEAA